MNAWLRHMPSATWPGVEDPWLALAEPLARSIRHEPRDRPGPFIRQAGRPTDDPARLPDSPTYRSGRAPRWIELATPGKSVVLSRVPVPEVHRVDRRLEAAH